MPASSGSPTLHFTRSGEGPPWLFLHGAAARGNSFDKVVAKLGREVTAFVPDLLGDGASVKPSAFDRVIDRELAALHATFARERAGFTVVGHSYGAVLALELARREVLPVEQLVLIEPTAFQLLAENSNHAELAKLDAVRRRCSELVAREDYEGAGREFISYWASEDVWMALSPDARRDVASGMRKVVVTWPQLDTLAVSLHDYARIDLPTLLVRGEKSPNVTRFITAKLAVSMPNAQLFDIAGVGHLSHVTHPKEIAFVLQRAARAEPLRETLTEL